jgi:putative transposase
MSNSEQALRQEAIRRRLAGESRKAICVALNRVTSWFDKWWSAYQDNPSTDFADRSRAPHISPQCVSEETARLIVSVRKQLSQTHNTDTPYELIGNRAIIRNMRGLQHVEIPSGSTVQRVLARAGLTQPTGAGAVSAYYPWLNASAVNDVFATDLITRYLHSKEEVVHFHTIDHFSHAVYVWPSLNKTTQTVCEYMRKTWAFLGLPLLHQFDNESTFCGGHTHPRVIGQVVRLCLFCGVEPIFTPFYDPKRNYQIESFHSLWLKAFWSRHEFANLAEVKCEEPKFLRWYLRCYDPPALNGRTPAQVRCGVLLRPFDKTHQSVIPPGRLPITKGFVHFMRKVDSSGSINVLNERWLVHKRLIGCYVCATIDLSKQQLTIWHKPDQDHEWQLIKTRVFQIEEPIHDLLPIFVQNRPRCRDYLPG